jgi:hypothetical protein
MVQSLTDGGDLAVGDEESVEGPIPLPTKEASSHSQVAGIVDVPTPDGLEDPILRGPIGCGRGGEGIEPVRHDKVQGRDPGQEEEVQVLMAGPETPGEGHRPRRVPEPLGVDREVPLDLAHGIAQP